MAEQKPVDLDQLIHIEGDWSDLADDLEAAQDAAQSVRDVVANALDVFEVAELSRAAEQLAEAFRSLADLDPALWSQSIRSFSDALRADRLATERFLSEFFQRATPMSDEEFLLLLWGFSTSPHGLALANKLFWSLTPREWWVYWEVWNATVSFRSRRVPRTKARRPSGRPRRVPVHGNKVTLIREAFSSDDRTRQGFAESVLGVSPEKLRAAEIEGLASEDLIGKLLKAAGSKGLGIKRKDLCKTVQKKGVKT